MHEICATVDANREAKSVCTDISKIGHWRQGKQIQLRNKEFPFSGKLGGLANYGAILSFHASQ